ncbi:MAG: TMEM175 family protein [Candidatus Thorarchaeota archaeon]
MASEEEPEPSLELERIVFFSDAVMAIVSTILVIELALPDLSAAEIASQLPDILISLFPKFISYFLSFTIIGSFWVRHHMVFSYIKKYDYRLIWLNIFFLLFLALIPFATVVLGAAVFNVTSIIFYSGIVASASFIFLSMWVYASRGYRLVSTSISKKSIQYEERRSILTTTSFLLAIPVALVDVRLSVIVWALTPLAFGIYRRISARQSRKSN